MQKIDPAKIANDVKTLIEKRATLKQMKGVTNDELEAVYSLAFGYYQTGKYEERSGTSRTRPSPTATARS